MKIESYGAVIEDSNDNLVETEEGVTCGCENPSLRMTCHMDGREFYTYNYQCTCGNSISVTRQRAEDDMMRWG